MCNDYIIADNMDVGYEKKPLIRQIEFHVKRGEIVTLIGPNGAGKSTILKTIIRQLKLMGGSVWLDGQQLEHMTEKQLAKRMSVLMTERIHPELMTCEDVVAAGRYPYTGRMGILTAEDKEKIKEALEMVHALDIASKEFTRVSDGQKQRIFLARTICQEPQAIVLDEPTSFLDIRHKLEILSILKDMVQKKNIAVLMSLHELDLAQKVSDYIVCVGNGKIERCGTPEEIFCSDYISKLYGITKGSYQAELGCLELEPVKGTPKVFVVGGNGKGISTYRKLQRQGIPFAAGILHENDIDYPIAKALASEVISEVPFETIQDKTFQQAIDILKKCDRMICCIDAFGSMNKRNQDLLAYGKKLSLNIQYNTER